MAMTASERSSRYRLKHGAVVRERAKLAQRERRARVKEVRAVKPSLPDPPSDRISALCSWSRDNLKVPPGHPLEGQTLEIPGYGVSFLKDCLDPGINEALICMARKNAKSAIIADLLLGFLLGPLRFPGFRAGVVSLNLAKASELHRQMHDISEASGLSGLQFLAWPRLTVKSDTGSVEILSADRHSGMSSSFDLSIVDELGLLTERDRPLINSMRSAVSAKGGQFLALTVLGDGPFVPEILKREGDPGLAIHLYQAPEDCALDDAKAWAAANPGLSCGIKQVGYMESESRRVSVTVSDESSFRALDLNQPVSPESEMIFSVSDWLKCVVPISDLPDRTGRCFIGFDLGGSSSLTALAVLFPENGRVEVWAACPSVPDLAERSRVDGVDYSLMAKRGELRTYAGRVTPVGEFLKDCAARLTGCKVIAAGADRYRKAEAMQALDDSNLRWPMVWRGMGASAKADGSHDVRALQKRVLSRNLFMVESVLMTSAIKSSLIRRDAAGNPALSQGQKRGRIDPLSALVIASGLSELDAVKPRRSYRSLGSIG